MSVTLRDKFYLLRRWVGVHFKLGESTSYREFANILRRHREPGRHYHGLQHIVDIMRFTDQHFSGIPEIHLTHAAIFYHDAIYDPTRRDNEQRSRYLWEDYAERRRFRDWRAVKHVSNMILMTAEHEVQDHCPLFYKAMCDADMSIFVRDEAAYDAYARDIWREYGPQAGGDAYLQGRLQFLKNLDVSRLFYTQQARALKRRAIHNINREITTLENDPGAIMVAL